MDQFYGKMRVQYAPLLKDVPPFTVGPQLWTYDKETDCWTSGSYSFLKMVCTPLPEGAPES